MTNEEKAEEYVNKRPFIHLLGRNTYFIQKEFRDAILWALAEGRKDDRQLKYIDFLVKENKDLQHRLDVAQGFLDRDVEYIKMCKAVKENAELKEKIGRAGHRIAELKMQIEKMKCCHNCNNFIGKSYCITPCNDHSKWEPAE